MRWFRRLFWPTVLLGGVLVLATDVPAAYVFGPLGGYLIARVGLASFGSLRAGASFVPDGPPEPLDVRRERVTYWCEGCGSELLLLVRGADTAPRHCGERMHGRWEAARTERR
jgi:hypothetical protein